MRCDLIGIKCWITPNSSPKIPLHSQNLLASYTCSNLFTTAKVGNVLTSHCSWPGSSLESSAASDCTDTKQLSKKVFEKGRISWNKTSPVSTARLQGMAQDPLEAPECCRKSNLPCRAQGNAAAHGMCHCIYSRAFSFPCYHKPDTNTLPWPKACGAFCQAK